MLAPFKSQKNFFTIAAIIIIALNLYTFSVAYPTMNQPLNLGGADLPRDFSVYYIAAWRMVHNPSQIFNTQTLNDGEPAIYPPITPYKYLPSFIVEISPLLSLSYYQAFWVFDAIQFIMLPIMAFLLYKLLEKNHPLVALVVLVAVLLLPYPMPGRGLSVSYFMSWAEGQAKIFVAFFLLLSFYLGYKGKPGMSGVAFALGAFDPRFAVLALPLFVFYNKDNFRRAGAVMVIGLVALNAVIFYPGTAQGFVIMVFGTGTTTPLYTPAWIPAIMLACLFAVNAKQMVEELKITVDVFGRKVKGASVSLNATDAKLQ
jgi:hypothetical protein